MNIKPFDRNTYLVESEHDPEIVYIVDMEEETCSCDDAEFRRHKCKHRKAVEDYVKSMQNM